MPHSFLSLFTPTASAAVVKQLKYNVAATATEYYTVFVYAHHIPDVVYLVSKNLLRQLLFLLQINARRNLWLL